MPILEVHPAAAFYPLLNGAKLEALVISMRERGFDPNHPIVLFEGKILDGRNRSIAAETAGVEPVFKNWEGTDEEAFEFAWQENGPRRHLDAGLLGCCRIEMEDVKALWIENRLEANQKRSEAAKERPRTEAGTFEASATLDKVRLVDRSGQTSKQIAAYAGVGHATVERGIELKKKRKDLFDLVLRWEITLNEAMRRMRKDEMQAKLQDLPTDKFRVIYADPPWSYGDRREEIGEGLAYGPVTGHYPPLALKDICAIDIKSICHEDAVLFLWVTAPLLPEGLDVMKAWGFEYKENIIWDKDTHNFGHYVSVRHESLFIGTRGSCLRECKKLFPSVVKIKKTDEHSKSLSISAK